VSIKDTFGLDYDMWDRLFKPVVNENTASILVTLMRPLSRGQIRLKSTDPADHPFIDPRYYSHPRDAEIMMEGHKHSNLIILSLGIGDNVIKPLNDKHPLLQV
jgi:choline dehydrogenase-like flavoprotein